MSPTRNNCPPEHVLLEDISDLRSLCRKATEQGFVLGPSIDFIHYNAVYIIYGPRLHWQKQKSVAKSFKA